MARSLLLLALALAACDAPFRVELPEHDSRLVVSSLFAADSVITLTVGRSLSVLDPDAPSSDNVTTATVSLFEDGTPVGEATYVPNRLRYISSVRARAGRTYRVRVEAAGFDPVEAEDTVPLPRPFEVDVVPGPTPTGGRPRVDAVTVRFADPSGEDFYALYGLSERRGADGAINQLFGLAFSSTDPLLTDGDLTGLVTDFDDPYYRQAFFRDRAFDGESVALQIDVLRVDSEAGAGFTERLRLAAVSETYYGYVRARDTGGVSTPFDTPRALPSNVVGGYGIFAAFAASEQVLPE